MPLPPDKSKRLAQLLGVALTSHHSGEALNALAASARLLSEHGLTVGDVLGGGFSAEDMQAVADKAYAAGLADGARPAAANVKPGAWAEFAKALLRSHDAALNEWERDFLRSWMLRRREPSPKQRAIFDKLADRLGEPLPGWANVA